MKLILTVVLIGLSSLFVQQKSAKLPNKRPSNFEFEYKTDGGMINSHSKLKISKDNCFYSQKDKGVETNKKIDFSDEQLDKFYQLLKENKFDKITSDRKEGVYDRGGITMSVLWDKNEIVVSNAQRDFVKDKWKKNWGNIVDSVKSIIKNRSN